MDAYIKRVLGEEKIKEIYDECDLDTEDRKILNIILEEWKGQPSNHSKKIKFDLETLRNSLHRGKIVATVLMLTMELALIELDRRLNAENN